MSVVVKEPDSGKSASRDVLHLTAVNVAFHRKRPRGNLRLVITINNEDCIVDIGKDDLVQWTGSIPCSVPSAALVRIQHKRSFLSSQWKDLTLIQTLLSPNLLPVTDSKQLVAVAFAISVDQGAAFHPDYDTQAILRSSVSSEANAAKEKLKKKEVVVEKLGKLWSVISIIGSVGEALSDIHPAIGASMSALKFLKEVCEKQEFCRGEALAVVELFEPFLSIESRIQELKQRGETRRAAEAMLNVISEASRYISDHTSCSMIGNLFGDEYQDKLNKIKTEFLRAKEDFDRSVQLEVFKAVYDNERITRLAYLHERLLVCEDAHFKSGEENICLVGTRVNLRERIMDWVNRRIDTRPHLFWLRGKAGSGKSTVANSVAQAMQGQGYLLSCFFCKRDDQGLSNPRRVLPTLSYRFAQQHESYRAVVFRLIDTDPRGAGIAATTDLDTQLARLFEGPLKRTVNPLQPHVVVIDALDECGSSRERTNLAKCILALSRLVPWIKVLVTSRDEPEIRNVFGSGSCTRCDINEEIGTEDDIRQYILSQAQLLKIQLSNTDVERLVRRTDGLFIWCSTLFKYLSKRHIPADALKPFLLGKEKHASWNQLYALYDNILESAAEDEEDSSFIRVVLAIVNVAARNRPVSTSAVVSFLPRCEPYDGCIEDHARVVVEKLHAVLYVDQSMNATVRAYHSSFYDFLQQKAITAASGWQRLEATHGCMFQRCMDVLSAQLRFNMCNIEVPVMNKDIQDLNERISANMSEELQYSSCFWFTHLAPSNLIKSDALERVSALLCSRKLLFWLESLSLLGSLSQSLLALEACMNFFQRSANFVAAASDAHRFVASFSEAMESVPHIYLSSLFWLPRHSRTYQNLELSRSTRLQLIQNKRDDWDVVVWERSIGKRLYSLAYSPDGRSIASGAGGGSIHILDARTGTTEGEALHGHHGDVNSLVYSPDGCFLASGSDDKTVRIWDVKTGESCIEPLTGHTAWVLCVAYSPSGQFIASGSKDATILIWDPRPEGVVVGEPLRGHSGGVWAVIYSPDGQYVASGGEDGDIRIWNTISHREARPPLLGHSDTVRSLSYSPDGQTIASGSYDHTIRVWNIRTGQAIGEPLRGHTSEVLCVMYSHDGQLILSSSVDCTIRIWDAASGAPVGEPLRGHNDWVRSLSCSPDGLFIASASHDGSVRLWDPPTHSKTQNQLQGHVSAVLAVTYSADGHHIATGSEDESVRFWDAQLGTPVGEPLRGHKGPVSSLVYSPDGLCITSGAGDGKVRIWDAQTGETIGEPLQRHSDWVRSVAYSPGGHYIASASDDGTVRLWDAQTGRAIGEVLQVRDWAMSVAFSPDGHSLACGSSDGIITVWDVSSREVTFKVTLRGHSGSVNSVAFSSDGQHLASGSDDCTVRIWNTQTGEPRGNSLQGHTDVVRSVVYSRDGCLIASCSDDRTIRVWDVRTGLEVGDALQGHSNCIYSVAFSPDNLSLVSGGEDARSFVFDVVDGRSSRSKAASSWRTCCSRMDERDGWVKDGETLLLWSPVPYRPILRSSARFMVSNYGVLAPEVDFETLFSYSGQAWGDVLSDIQSL